MELDMYDLKYEKESYWNVKRFGGIKIHMGRGVAWSYQDNKVSPDKLITPPETLSNVAFVEDAPVFFDGKEIGKVQDVIHVQSDGSLLIFFNLLSKLPFNLKNAELQVMNDVVMNQQECVAVPRVEAQQIKCVTCGNIYDVGQTPCNCIQEGNAIIPLKMMISGMEVYNAKTDYKEPDNKSPILRKFFGGAISNIVFTDPI